MSYEIHMIKAGNADAIAFRHIFRVPGVGDTQFVAIIDGGNEEHGHELVDIVKNYYATNFVDLVVCTHHDNDHITGLKVVVEKLRISRVWVHNPANHGYFYSQIRQALQRTTAKSYAQGVLRNPRNSQ